MIKKLNNIVKLNKNSYYTYMKNKKHEIFAQKVAENGKKYAKKAVEEAGYKNNFKTWAKKLLKNKNIKARIRELSVDKSEIKEDIKTGRPPYYDAVEDMQKEIDKYFQNTEIITITGLALCLGFTSRQALMNYQSKDMFFDTIKRAKLRIEMAYEERLVKNGRGGDVFALKNFGWVDKQEVESTNINMNKDIDDNMTEQEASQIYQFIMKGK